VGIVDTPYGPVMVNEIYTSWADEVLSLKTKNAQLKRLYVMVKARGLPVGPFLYILGRIDED
jgi:hypothetical protein